MNKQVLEMLLMLGRLLLGVAAMRFKVST